MKIAIVSSYKLECGIARFSEVLHRNFSPFNEVTVFELSPQELKKSFGATDSEGDRFIDDMCEQLKTFDAVSIQCEYGLFSDALGQSIARIKRLLDANSNSTITFHTIFSRSSSAETTYPSLARLILRPRSTVVQFGKQWRISRTARHELNLLEHIRKNKSKVIVHTDTTKRVLQQRFKLQNVECHPLCYTSENEKAGYNHEQCRQELIDRLGLDNDSKLIGVFGFFGGYKGFDYAIKCIARLPEDYKLLIFSGLHPSAIKESDTSQIDELVGLCRKNKVLGRIFFMGSVDDTSMYKAIAGVDYSWLPYREVGQEASAICSEVAELSRRMIISRNFAFVDYMKFNLRDDYEFFEIGNVEELRLKTIHYDTYHPRAAAPTTRDHASLQTRFYMDVLGKPAV
jgi:glycosyltransferase involved in cell wall biosynthesis